MSGVDFDSREVRKGAADAIAKYLGPNGNSMSRELNEIVERVSREGGTPLVVAEDRLALGVIQLKDIVKGGMVNDSSR
jgi:K+-transporting ATPase ATPase B chain